MKFDPKFVRNLLFLYEEADYAGKTPMWIAEGSITDTGKDYLDKIKNPLVWKKTQKILLSATKVTLQSILSTAISVAING